MSQTQQSVSEARLKGRANAAAFIASLDDLFNGWDDDRGQNDRDGIPTRSANFLVAEHTARKLSMRKRFTSKQPLFSQDEVAEDASALSVAVAEVDPNDIDRRMKWGYTPLIQAAVDGDYAECKRLKDAGADIALKDNGGKTACQKAEARGFDTIVELLS